MEDTGPATGNATERALSYLTTDVTMIGDGHRRSYPILEVAFKNGMWWSMPDWASGEIYKKYKLNEDVEFVWPREDGPGARNYRIDFAQMLQSTTDNNPKRSVRWIWLGEDKVAPAWSGQIQYH